LKDSRAREAIIQSSIVGYLISKFSPTDPDSYFANYGEVAKLKPIMEIIDSLMSYSNGYKQVFIDCNVLEVVKKLLLSDHQSFYTFGCFLVGYICQGTKQQIQQVIDCGLFPLLSILLESEIFRLRVKVGHILNSASYYGSYAELKQIAEQGSLRSLCNVLDLVDNRLTGLALLTINNFLIVERNELTTALDPKEKLTQFALIIKGCGGVDKIKKLVSHEKAEIRFRAACVLKYGFSIDAAIDRPITNCVAVDNSDDDIEECKICFDRASDTVLIPCGHQCVCHECAAQMFDATIGVDLLQVCPICRRTADHANRI